MSELASKARPARHARPLPPCDEEFLAQAEAFLSEDLEPARRDDAASREQGPEAPAVAAVSKPAPDRGAQEQEIKVIAADLLVGIQEPGPAAQVLAHRTAAAMRRVLALEAALDRSAGLLKQDWISLNERINRLRETEDKIVARGVFALDLLRERRAEVRVVQPVRRKRASAAG